MHRSSAFAHTPAPPYYTVIFSSKLRDGDDGYDSVAQAMVELASAQAGFLGVESARDSAGFGITVSYWASLESISAWKSNLEHLAAQELGRKRWYEHYEVRVARVERAYHFDADDECRAQPTTREPGPAGVGHERPAGALTPRVRRSAGA